MWQCLWCEHTVQGLSHSRCLCVAVCQDLWDPSTDEYIPVQYGPEDVVQGESRGHGQETTVVGVLCSCTFCHVPAMLAHLLHQATSCCCCLLCLCRQGSCAC